MKKTATFLLVLFSSLSLVSFVDLDKSNSIQNELKIYRADFVTKRIKDPNSVSTKTSMFILQYEKVDVVLDANDYIVKISSVENIDNSNVLNEFIGEKINFDKNNIAKTTERSNYNQNIQNKNDKGILFYYFLKIDKTRLKY